ncbi:MAG: acyl-CoA-binding protein [Ketobacteraceae bacterium]|nr:acyl-CoA-binding protein [Ketobacteraceae bacterium]
MGKLKEMVAEETSLANRVKTNARRLQMAGIGLFAKLDEERIRLYKQVVEASDVKTDDTVIGKLNTLGNGVVNLAREESVKLFDELVEAGEKYQSEGTGGAGAGKKTRASGSSGKAKSSTPARKAQRKTRQTSVDPDLQKAFAAAQAKAEKISDLGHEQELELMALALQAKEGDVKGRRPAKDKVEECEVFDARREIKGMKQQEAMAKYVETVQKIA